MLTFTLDGHRRSPSRPGH